MNIQKKKEFCPPLSNSVVGGDNMDHIAKPVLEKEQVMKEIAEHLTENPKTSIDRIRSSIYARLNSEGIIGRITERGHGMTTTFDRDISDEDALLINECVYDLLYDRTITPGANSDQLNLPLVHVTDNSKLKKIL